MLSLRKVIITTTFLFTCNSAVYGQDLTSGLWDVEALGFSGNEWNDTSLIFLSQSPNGSDFDVTGYFDWIRTNNTDPDNPGLGRETFTGTLFADRSLQLLSTGAEPIPGLGGPTFNGGSEYFATLSSNGSLILDGTWVSPGGTVNGNWSATRIPEPTSVGLLGLALTVLAFRRRSQLSHL